MSETVTLGTGTAVILGTYAGAVAYVERKFSAKYVTWLTLTATQRKQTLAQAVDYINAQDWQDDYDTFAERDAIEAFQFAQYELAVLIKDDESITDAADQGSNIASVSAGGASVSYFLPTTDGAPALPPVLMRLVGSYLSGGEGGVSVIGGFGNTGAACSPFSADEDYDP